MFDTLIELFLKTLLQKLSMSYWKCEGKLFLIYYLPLLWIDCKLLKNQKW